VTAAVKRERLEAIFGERPEHVRYVEVDFNREDLAERLAAHGFDREARSIVLWSGVTPYLEEEGVVATLEWFAAGTGPGSAICFDYLWQEVVDGDDSYYGAKQLRARVEAGGEPFRFGIPRGETAKFVERFGLVLEEDLGPEEAHQRILHGAGEPYGFGGMALVRREAVKAAGLRE
jgi:methyltransferase (TIGR00027 family)